LQSSGMLQGVVLVKTIVQNIISLQHALVASYS
jgi:hypothetical protein